MTNKILTAEQVADFRRDGFLVARSLFNTEQMREITA